MEGKLGLCPKVVCSLNCSRWYPNLIVESVQFVIFVEHVAIVAASLPGLQFGLEDGMVSMVELLEVSRLILSKHRPQTSLLRHSDYAKQPPNKNLYILALNAFGSKAPIPIVFALAVGRNASKLP